MTLETAVVKIQTHSGILLYYVATGKKDN